MATKTDKSGALPIKPIIADGKTKLADIDPASTCKFVGTKDDAAAQRADLTAQLVRLQDVLFAEHQHKILVIVQAMDTAGKDGVIRNCLSGINPQGMRVASFKAPSPEELDHDYLWRIHRKAPRKGELVVFNRSHYEDVLITRVHGWIDDATAKRRLRQINDFETMLVEEGTTIIKFFLHISKDEQKQRLQNRLVDPTKRWKFQTGDLAERKKWDDYQRVYEETINSTSSPHSPWYIVPSDRKWVRDVYVSAVLVQAMSALDMQYPAAAAELNDLKVE